MIKKVLFLAFLVAGQANALSSNGAQEERCDISGVWQHAGKPAELSIDLSKGEIKVHSHELNPNAVGLVVIKNVKPTPTVSSWSAKMYHAQVDDFVTINITAENCKKLNLSHQGDQVLSLNR